MKRYRINSRRMMPLKTKSFSKRLDEKKQLVAEAQTRMLLASQFGDDETYEHYMNVLRELNK